MQPRMCQRCNAVDLTGCSRLRKYCTPCAPLVQKDTGARWARWIVCQAVAKGELAPIKTLRCTDCAKPAEHYDHRDYSKPLEVEPVCMQCNFNRGPAKPAAPLDGRLHVQAAPVARDDLFAQGVRALHALGLADLQRGE